MRKSLAVIFTIVTALAVAFSMGRVTPQPVPAAKAVDASGISVQITFLEYGTTTVLECGEEYEVATWVASRIEAKATTPGTNGQWQVETHYGEVGVDTPDEDGLYKKFDRMQWEKVNLTGNYTRYGRADWFNQTPNEAYVWQFQVWAEGHYLSAFSTGERCDITVTKVE